jgi:hypothetical protein
MAAGLAEIWKSGSILRNCLECDYFKIGKDREEISDNKLQ